MATGQPVIGNELPSIGPEGGRIVGLAISPRAPHDIYAIAGDLVFHAQSDELRWQIATRLYLARSATVTGSGVAIAGGIGGAMMTTGDGWVPVTALHGYTIEVMAADPADPSRVFAAGSVVEAGRAEAAFLATTDGGMTWEMRGSRGSGIPRRWYYPRWLAVDPRMPDRLVLATSFPSPPMLESHDAGVRWQPPDPGLPCDMDGLCLTAFAVAPSNADTHYAGLIASSVHRSDDGGANWSPTRAVMDAEHMVYLLAVHPTDERIAYAAVGPPNHLFNGREAVFELFKTVDAGGSWERIGAGLPNVPLGALVFEPDLPSHLFAATGGNFTLPANGVYESHDGGTSWHAASAGLTATCAHAVSASATQPTTLHVGVAQTPVGVRTSFDAGRSWSTSAPVRRAAGVFAVAPQRAETVYTITSSQDGSALPEMMRTVDGGRSWTLLEAPSWFYDVAVDRASASTVYAIGDAGVSRSVDAAEHWTTVHGSSPAWGLPLQIAVDPVDRTVYALYERALFTSPDRGETWALTSTPHLSFPRTLAVAPTSPRTLYVLAQEGLIISRDRGRTWQPAAVPVAPGAIAAMAVDPRDARIVYVAAGTEAGVSRVLRSDDGGDTWRFLDGEIPDPVFDAAVDANDSATLYVATCGNGVVVVHQAAPPSAVASGDGCAIGPPGGAGARSVSSAWAVVAALLITAIARRRP